MTDVGRTFVREPGAENPSSYRERVSILAAIYVALFLGSLFGIALLVWKGQHFVTLAQRSNVETLTLAFFLVLFGYLSLLSARGALGALQVARFAALARVATDRGEVERRKMRALGPPRQDPPSVSLNVVVELEGQRGERFDLQVGDSAAEMGRVEVDGCRLTHHPRVRDGSNELLAYVTRQIEDVLGERRPSYGIDVVSWKRTDDEGMAQYHATVEFARGLERALGRGPLWPTVVLTQDDRREIERRISAICSALRNEGFLPQWDFQGEHKVPIIPEPLGLLSLSRSERRVDPVSSMGCAVLVVLAALGALALLVAAPPWVPGI